MSPGSELLFSPLPPGSRSSTDRANPGSRQEEVWRLGSISEASEGSRQGAGRRLAVPGSQVQLSSILGDNIYNVPSPRIIPPACPPSVFPADGFSRLLNNWLGSGAPGSLTAALQAPHPSAGCPTPWGEQNTKLGHRWLFPGNRRRGAEAGSKDGWGRWTSGFRPRGV